MQVIHQPVNFVALNIYGSLYGSTTYTSYTFNSYTMDTRGSPDIYTLSPWATYNYYITLSCMNPWASTKHLKPYA